MKYIIIFEASKISNKKMINHMFFFIKINRVVYLMEGITDIAQVEKYAGCIVEFEDLNSVYYKEEGEYVNINDKTFGYIGIYRKQYMFERIGYIFPKFYNVKNYKGERVSITHHNLTSDGLNDLKLRLATQDEVQLIVEKLLNGNTRFASGDYHLTEVLNTHPV